MRYLFLLSLLSASLMCHAQQWTIAAEGGVVFNSKTSKPTSLESMPNVPGGAAGLELGYHRGHWEFGLGASYRRYAVRIHGEGYFENDFDPITGTVINPPTTIDFLKTFPTIAVTPFIRRHFQGKKTDWFAGLRLGYARLTPQVVATDTTTGEQFFAETTPAGFTAGVQGGCNYSLSKHVALRAALSLDGLWLKAFSLQGAMLTAGLQYRFGK